MVRRWRRSAAAMVVLAAAVVGCGRSGDETSVKTDLVAAVEAAQATTARVSASEVIRAEGTNRYEGELDFEHRSGHLRIEFGRPWVEKPDDEDLKGIPEEIRDQYRRQLEVMATLDEMIVIGDHGYLGAKGHWYDAGQMEDDPDSDIDVFSPTEILDQVRATGDVHEVGTEAVRGVDATHYSATNRKNGDQTDVWVDGSGRAVRVTVAYKDPKPHERSSETMDLYDFGADVDIEAPADAEPFDQMGGLQPKVDLKQVATGIEGTVAWTLSIGELEDGRPCVQVATRPELDGEIVQLFPDGTATSSETATGQPPGPSCGPTVGDEFGHSGAVLLTVGGRHGEVHYLAGLLDDGADVSITFEGGRKQKLEGHDGAFVVFFSGDAWPTSMSGRNTTCELPGDSTISASDLVC